MSSINAVHGFEFGSGFEGTSMKGSAHNDVFTAIDETQARTASNYSGGLQGGISNGMPIYGKVAFKPISSIRTAQQMLNKDNQLIEKTIEGRHDACPVPRAVPIVEAHLALTLLDAYLQNRLSKW
jgi:chorismate synthase